ncbi:MAG: M20/M25/M40 family metallo-hydrolase [Actinomycetota bacterium]|nr:M20/M25/M40 family metallo-hydrolase [Actinomycetota bacterium]
MTHSPPTVTSTDVVELLTELIKFDSTNWGDGRSNGELAVASWVVEQLQAVGWRPQLLARSDAPERANVVLRVPGADPTADALLVHAHLDVVPAEPKQWSVDPFAGQVSDGYVWGRGAVDMKDMCASTLATLLRWGRTGERPCRDVVVAFVADEEDRGEFGARWLAEEHADLFDGVAAAIGESGGSYRQIGRDDRSVRLYPVAAAERGTMHLRLTARGASGHGSRPQPGHAVAALLDALHRLAHHEWPIRLSPAVRGYLAGTAGALGLPVDLDSDAGIARCISDLGEHADVARFTIRASATPTRIDAGYKVNVIPGIATAAVDVRCPPGFEQQLAAELGRLIGTEVEFEFSTFEPPVAAPLDGPWFDAISAAIVRADPQALVVPFCMGGGTDAKAFSKLGIACYGFAPLGADPDGRTVGGVHGVDERVPIASLEWGAAVLHDFLTTV